MREVALALVVLCGCGRVGFDNVQALDADGPAIDAAMRVVDANLGDAPAGDAAATIATGPFGPPTLIPELSDGSLDDDDPSLTRDLLEIYLKRDSGPATGFDIYVSTRPDLASLWSPPVRSDTLSSDAIDNTPEVSADGLTIHLSSSRGGIIDVYRSTRPNRGAAWSTPVRVPELSSAEPDFAVATDSAGVNLAMTRSLAGNLELFSASRSTPSDPWDPPVAIAELNTERFEADAVLDESGLHIFYTAESTNPMEGKEVHTASRVNTGMPFGPSVPLDGVNSLDDDEDPWLSADLSTIFFVRNTANGRDIYFATRPPAP